MHHTAPVLHALYGVIWSSLIDVYIGSLTNSASNKIGLYSNYVANSLVVTGNTNNVRSQPGL
jgi:hypothetical protein